MGETPVCETLISDCHHSQRLKSTVDVFTFLLTLKYINTNQSNVLVHNAPLLPLTFLDNRSSHLNATKH